MSNIMSQCQMLARKCGTAITRPAYAYSVARDILFARQVPPKSERSLLNDSNSISPPDEKVMHLAVHDFRGNAGDVLLPIVLRDLFDTIRGKPINWELCQLRPAFQNRNVRQANSGKGVVIGGGGLFLRDTNANLNSGWQWNCSIEKLRSIRVPIVVFAVGYNRFRGQSDFDPIFKDHLAILAEKSTYIGLRNRGSLRALKQYLPESLHDRLRYQPCMTTLLAKVYPHLVAQEATRTSRPAIAFNAAFDRAKLRYGENQDEVLTRLAKAIKVACRNANLHVVLHCTEDIQIIPYLRDAGCEYTEINLIGALGERIVQYYSSVSLAVGMRGHAQLIPFGCGTPILSLISHDKLRWFLEDIGKEEWGIDIHAPEIHENLTEKVAFILDNEDSTRRELQQIQNTLWDLTKENVETALTAFEVATKVD